MTREEKRKVADLQKSIEELKAERARLRENSMAMRYEQRERMYSSEMIFGGEIMGTFGFEKTDVDAQIEQIDTFIANFTAQIEEIKNPKAPQRGN